MSHRTSTWRRTWKERALSLLLAAALVAGLVPGLTLPASAEHWADAYLDQMVDWGVMRADQTANPDADLTRAEFMAIVNRAYGYTELGPIPFEDVLETDWFYDDISIAYTAGYMAGTSETTASPNDSLTREQAICILGRNMMMKDAPGESLAFADSRDVSDWARGTLKAAADNYIISGYPDNTIHPKDLISKAQMAVLISQSVGTPIQQSGTYDLGGVFGNVTITAPNVTLRNAVISGDLYISGGVGLGGIKLENVDVLGRIIVSSTGESEGGEASVIMRNVTADEMLLDNMQGKTVTVRADGITDIANTVVRTDAYLEDNNTDDKGLMRIELDGEPGTRLTLAGRIKEVVDKTPSSYIQAAQGTVAKLTVDEAATNSTVQIDRNTKVAEMNLDVATYVLGDGDIGQLNINAPGSVVTMLPDKIYIRPGLTASIAGVIMDYQAAAEGSLDPRLLSGYPAANDIAPTGFRADFAANKKGTIYWAVSYVSDGSIEENDLISPPSYGSKAITNGSLAAPAGGDEVSAQVGSLVVGGSYYLSAIVVDEQSNRSPVKVISFSTPDNTVPAFAEGYPYMSRTTRSVAQVTVMPTKSCKLYYALLPKGAKAPTTNELKAAAVSGSLGYGVRDVTKNTESVFTVNSQRLEELKDYVLYLWLSDVDGINSSAITSLSFKIPDETPPEFTVDPHVNGNVAATSIPMAATVNEDATIFWAVVPEGDYYPLPNLQSSPLSKDNEMEDNTPVSSKLTSDYAKLCVTSGMGAISKGQVTARGGVEVTFNVTGLLAEKAYDFYYVARDTAGNYSVTVKKLTGGLHTLDETGPTIIQSFTALASRNDPDSPLSSTDITLDFSENIRCSMGGERKDFVTLYNDRNNSKHDMELFVDALSKSIQLYKLLPEGDSVPVTVWDGTDPMPEEWIRYDKVTVTQQSNGHVEVTFPGLISTNDLDQSAVRLANGVQYFFRFFYLTDTANDPNPLDEDYNVKGVDYEHAEDKHHIPPFTTAFSQVRMTSVFFSTLPEYSSDRDASSKDPNNANYVRQDIGFRLNPETTSNTPDDYIYDLLIYADTTIEYDLYYRIVSKTNSSTPLESGGEALQPAVGDKPADTYFDNLIFDYSKATRTINGEDIQDGPDSNGWRYLGNSDRNSAGNGKSLNTDFTACSTTYPKLKSLSEDLYYEFLIVVTEKNGVPEYSDWNGEVGFDVYIVAGSSKPVQRLGSTPTAKNRDSYISNGLNGGGVANIGVEPSSGNRYLHDTVPFSHTAPPSFTSGYPVLYNDEKAGSTVYDGDGVSLVGDTFAWLQVNLTAPGKVHYVVGRRSGTNAIRTNLTYTVDPDTNVTITEDDKLWSVIPTDGHDSTPNYTVNNPTVLDIAEPNYPDTYPQGEEEYVKEGSTIPIYVDGLQANTEYYVYFVLEAQSGDETSAGAYSEVYVYKFRTAKTSGPKINMSGGTSDGVVQVITPNTASNLTYLIYTQTVLDNSLANNGDLAFLFDSLSDYVNDLKQTVGDTTSTKTGKDYLPPAYQDKTETVTKEDGSTESVTTKYTVLQSLIDAYTWNTAIQKRDDNGLLVNMTAQEIEAYYFPPGEAAFNDYSVFDAYADQTLKEKVYYMIKQGILGTPVDKSQDGSRDVPTQRNVSRSLNSTKDMDSDVVHVVLVTGCSSNEGVDSSLISNYTFKAYGNVRIVDNTTAKLIPGGSSLAMLNSTDGQIFSGTVTLGFVGDDGQPKDVYWAESNSLNPTYVVHSNCPDKEKDNCKDILEVLGKGTVTNSYQELVELTSSSTGGRTFTINFSNLTVNTPIVFPAGSSALTNAGGTKRAGSGRILVSRQNDGSYLLTVTWTTQGETNPVVVAEWPWSPADNTGNAPILFGHTAVYESLKPSSSTDYKKYTGSFSVRFNQSLYIADSTGVNANLTSIGDSGFNFASHIKIDPASSSAAVSGTVTASAVGTEEIKFELANWPVGQSFTVFSGEILSNLAGNKRSANLRVTLREDPADTDAEGTYKVIYLDIVMEGTAVGSSIERYTGIEVYHYNVPSSPAGASLNLPAATAPALTSVATSNVSGTATGSYSMTLGLTFDQALYTKSGNKVTAVSGSKLATTSTVAYAPVKAGSSKGTITSSGSGKTYTLTLKNVKPGTLTLPAQTFYDKTGQASTTGTITVEIKEVKSSGNSSKLAITTPQVTVSFGDFEQTKILK